ncbi:hypothetical protein JRQ81_017699 [Phrynocephalus forsythii]|uniref:Uncharacterized protein n=1 Tax=Phrynocephalus forsythii TaxID=171643 RepID=A0A9Q0XRE0_9SAUR|nr:hypothetical protein JRQ81_017699 [Phrynocephalus forsythii]
MAGFWGLFILLLMGFLILHYLKFLWSIRKYPPGPFPLPLIGGFWKIQTPISLETFMKLSKQYGNIYTVWIGSFPMVVLSGYQTVKEGLISHTEYLAERPTTPFITEVFQGGILNSNGHNWKQNRRFGLITMRKLGVGKKFIENKIQEEAHNLVEIFAQAKEQPLDPSLPLLDGISNVIRALIFGNNLFPDKEQFQEVIRSIEFGQKFLGTFFHMLYESSPSLMKFLPGPHKKALSRLKQSKSMLTEVVKKYKQSHLQHEPEDFTEYYLLQIEKSKGDPSSIYDEENLVQCIFDLIVAGTETSTNSLQWGLLFLAHHPDIQEKVYKELEDVLGSSPSICYQDAKKLPYTQAVIHETLRIRYILPLGVPRRSAQDLNLFGYNIPKGTFCMANLPALFLDPEQWKTPQEFNPSHFLDEDGNFVLKEDFVPFGAGARVCLGEQLGKMELFIFLTYLIRAFHFQPTEGVEELNKAPVFGFTLHPQPFKIRAIPRSS